MMDLVLEPQIDQALAQLEQIRRDQVPFAISLTVGRLALKTQRGVQAGVAARMMLRRPQFVLRTIKIEKYDFATKRNPTTFRVKIDEDASRDFLAKFEDQGVKESIDPNFPIAIPSSNLRASRAELVPRPMFPKALRLVESRGTVGTFMSGGKRKHIFGTLPRREHRTSRGVLQVKGKRGTFILDPREHMGVKTWGVYQRVGADRDVKAYASGKSGIRLLWTFKTRIPIPRTLRFEATARDVIERGFQIEFSQAYAQALATARPA